MEGQYVLRVAMEIWNKTKNKIVLCSLPLSPRLVFWFLIILIRTSFHRVPFDADAPAARCD